MRHLCRLTPSTLRPEKGERKKHQNDPRTSGHLHLLQRVFDRQGGEKDTHPHATQLYAHGAHTLKPGTLTKTPAVGGLIFSWTCGGLNSLFNPPPFGELRSAEANAKARDGADLVMEYEHEAWGREFLSSPRPGRRRLLVEVKVVVVHQTQSPPTPPVQSF